MENKKGAFITVCSAVCAAALLSSGCASSSSRAASQPPVALESTNPCATLASTRHDRPRYPRAAVASLQQGWVAMKYHVAANGDVVNVRVVASSPEGVFDNASVAALAHSRYAAMTYPVRNCSQIDYYTLNGAEFAALR